MFTPVIFCTYNVDSICDPPIICVWIKANELAHRYWHGWEEPTDAIAEKLSKHYGAVHIEPQSQLSLRQERELMQIIKQPVVRRVGYWKIIKITDIVGPLYTIQAEARKEDVQRTQDMHSLEYKNWLADRAHFYNNGFYEYACAHDICTTSTKLISDMINRRYEELFTCTEHVSEKYSGCYSVTYSDFIIARYGQKYIVYGTGTNECGSDWMDFYIFYTYDRLEDIKALDRPTVHKKPANGTDITELYEFCAKHKIQLP